MGNTTNLINAKVSMNFSQNDTQLSNHCQTHLQKAFALLWEWACQDDSNNTMSWANYYGMIHKHWFVKFGPNFGPQALQGFMHDK